VVAVIEIARHPAALHQHHPFAALQPERGHHEEAHPRVHLTVVEEHGALGHPGTAQTHGAVHAGRGIGRTQKLLRVPGFEATTLVDLRLQGELLRRAIQLPQTE
jgi:hypothetical protein